MPLNIGFIFSSSKLSVLVFVSVLIDPKGMTGGFREDYKFERLESLVDRVTARVILLAPSYALGFTFYLSSGNSSRQWSHVALGLKPNP